MIISRAKNQKAAKQIIVDFVSLNVDDLPIATATHVLHLAKFLKYFSKHIMNRVIEQDCYFVDMLEDFERME
jgi:hypothetical protein